jgi:hypothetical protein
MNRATPRRQPELEQNTVQKPPQDVLQFAVFSVKNCVKYAV